MMRDSVMVRNSYYERQSYGESYGDESDDESYGDESHDDNQ